MNHPGYFDYNATTPMCEPARAAFMASLDDFGNPSGRYGLAQKSRLALAGARRQVADLVGCRPAELVFTSGGTEANNWAIKGALMARGALGCAATSRPHIIVSEIEHSSVLEIAAHLERVFGVEVTRLKPDRQGLISSEAVSRALQGNTQLVSIMLVNNEVGSLQPVRAIADVLRPRGIHFHVDGVQAVGKIEVDASAIGVDTLSFAAHKFYGPKGVGGLFIRDGIEIEPLLHGGGQENGRRGGTEAVAAIASMGAAAEATLALLPALLARLTGQRQRLAQLLIERVPGVSFNGPGDVAFQAPNTLSVRIEGIRAEALAAVLDQVHGIQVSLGSACSNNSKTVSLSHVLVAMGLSEADIKATLRVSLGNYTAEEDLTRFADAVSSGVRALQRISKAAHHEDVITA